MTTDSLRHVRRQLDFSKRTGLWLSQLAIDVLVAAAMFRLLAAGTLAATVLASLLAPWLYFNAFALMHEAVHRTLSQRRTINDVVGVIAGAFCFLPFEPWRQIHIEHHLWAGNVDRDPVNKLRKDYDPQKVVKYRILSAIWRSWLPLLALLQHTVFWLYPLQLLKSNRVERGHGRVFAASYLVAAGIYAAVALVGARYFPLTRMIPGLVLYLMLVEFVNLPHHLDLPTYRGETRLALLEQYKIARSGIYPRWFSRFVLLNFNLHLEHHLYPNLPWHELEKARLLVKPLLKDEYNETYGSQWLLQHRGHSLGELLAPCDETPVEKPRQAA